MKTQDKATLPIVLLTDGQFYQSKTTEILSILQILSLTKTTSELQITISLP
jgi:hypothetical protein